MATLLLRAYQATSTVSLPFIARHRINRLRRAGLPVHRAHEVLGHATQQRRLGPMIWVHGAAADQLEAAPPIAQALTDLQPTLRLLITSDAPDTKDILTNKGLATDLHQFAPLDAGGPVRRFLKHWRPDLALFLEHAFKPNLLETVAQANIPLVLLNAHLSPKTQTLLRRGKSTASRLFGHFGVIHCQDPKTEQAFHAIGLRHARRGVELTSIFRPNQAKDLAQQCLNLAQIETET